MAQARIDQIAVRLVNLPEGLRNNSSPVKISGTVDRQNPDGSVDIKTDKGTVSILLRDRGSLPQGSKIDIEIPAGKSPQQASIRQSDQAHAQQIIQQDKATLAQTLAQSSNSTQPTNQLESKPKLNNDTLGSVITSTQNQITEEIPIAIPIAGGALQAGQMARLLPVPPGSLPPAILNGLISPRPLPDLVSDLVNLIETLPKEQAQLRTTLITLLSRMDLSSLTHPSATTPPHITESNSQLLGRVGHLLQSIGISINFKNDTAAPNSPSPLSPPTPSQGFAVFNPSKPIDGQILAFQSAPAGATGTPPSATPSGAGGIILSSQLLHAKTLQTSPVSMAQVLGFTDTKLPLLSVPLPNTGLTQIYTLQFKADNLSTGAPVFIALDPLSTRPTQTLFTQSADGTFTLNQSGLTAAGSGLAEWLKSDTWDSLDTLMKSLLHSAPAQAQGLAQMIPTPAQPQSMAALSMFFLSLLRSGQPEALMATETITLLRQMGKADLLRAVTTDMTLASKIDGLSLPQDWRMTMLPLLWDHHVHRTPLYYKHFPDEQDKDGEQTAKKRRKLRFLFDLNLSRMGGVQVDGFMQSERLDIILRTKSPLSTPMQSQMKRIYAGAMDKSRLTGDLSFQFKPEHWVDFSQPLEKMGLNA